MEEEGTWGRDAGTTHLATMRKHSLYACWLSPLPLTPQPGNGRRSGIEGVPRTQMTTGNVFIVELE